MPRCSPLSRVPFAACAALLAALAPLSERSAAAVTERELSEALAAGARAGEAVWLGAAPRRFLALYRAPRGAGAAGGVVILHGLSGHPDSAAVVRPLRIGLPEHGWHTLSLALPRPLSARPAAVRAAIAHQGPPRIAAAVAFLKDKGVLNQVIVGYGSGASAAVQYLAGDPEPSVKGFVAVSPLFPGVPVAAAAASMARVPVPLLEFHGGRDLKRVKRLARAHAAVAGRSTGHAFRQLEIAGAPHTFHGFGELLVKRTRGWLQRTVPGRERLKVRQ